MNNSSEVVPEAKKLTAEELKPEFFLVKNIDSLRKKYLKSQTSESLMDKNPLKRTMHNLECKNTNGWLYKLICLILSCYVLFLQIKAFLYNSTYFWGMLPLTILFFILATINWSSPLLKIKSLAWNLPPIFIWKMLWKNNTGVSPTIKREIRNNSLHRLMVVAVVFLLLISVVSISTNLSTYTFKINNFFSDIFGIKKEFSSDFMMEYFIFITIASMCLLFFSNIFYAYEKIKIMNIIEKISVFHIIFAIILGFICMYIVFFDTKYVHINIEYMNSILIIFLATIFLWLYICFFYLSFFSFSILRQISIIFNKHIGG